MYNALEGIKEGKVVKINESTLKRIVERVIKEQEVTGLPIAFKNNVSVEDLTEEQLEELYDFIRMVEKYRRENPE
eukprot:SAG31_NODE_2974_length_4834_cov_3.830623_5_plen_75_part_00